MPNKLYLIFLFLLVLPIVNASSFTGTFSSYGLDIGTDGLFNYLVINATVNIDHAGNYSIFGIMQDAQGNVMYATSDKRKLAIGKYNLSLYYEGTDIYRNKVNGNFTLTQIDLSSIPDGGNPPNPPIDTRYNAHITKYYNYDLFQRGTASVYCNESPCIAPSSLIRSKDSISIRGGSTPIDEPNSPNTVDGCEDGNQGTYLGYADTIENMTIKSLNHSSYFKVGDTINVDMSVYCSGSSSKLNFVYSNDLNDIQWKIEKNANCPSSGFKNISTTFKLDNNIGKHVIRGVFGFGLQSNIVCGQDDASQYMWTDTDDLVIQVKECNSNPDCSITECNQLDMCYNGTYRNYTDMNNICDSAFACTSYSCTSYDEIITDNDHDDYDTNCDNDCNDENADINPGKAEICDNGIDDNCNQKIDSNDPECLGKYELNINQGWNLFSFPKINSTNITEIIKQFNNNYEKVLLLKKGKWHIYDKSYPSSSNLKNIGESQGFWIKAITNQSILVENKNATNVRFNLTKGWNMIGYPSLEQKDANDLFRQVMDNIEVIYTYNNGFQSFNPQRPNNLLIKPGAGILIKVKNNALWQFNNIYTLNVTEESFSLDLNNGWNSISLPLSSNKKVSDTFSQKKLYFMENNNWKLLQGNNQLNYSYSYWVNSSQTSVNIEGTPITSISFSIKKGFNTINYPLTQENSVASFFSSVMFNIDSISTFENGAWKTYNPERPAELNTLTTLKPGIGIFVKAKDNADWNFNGNEIVAT